MWDSDRELINPYKTFEAPSYLVNSPRRSCPQSLVHLKTHPKTSTIFLCITSLTLDSSLVPGLTRKSILDSSLHDPTHVQRKGDPLTHLRYG